MGEQVRFQTITVSSLQIEDTETQTARGHKSLTCVIPWSQIGSVVSPCKLRNNFMSLSPDFYIKIGTPDSSVYCITVLNLIKQGLE